MGSQTHEGIWVPGYGDLTEAVKTELTRGLAARPYIMERQMRRAAAAGRERVVIEDKDGGGEIKMMIHPYSYHYWGQRLGYDCWKDKQFCAEYLRDNDWARVKSRSRKPKTGWRATPGTLLPGRATAHKRCTINYG